MTDAEVIAFLRKVRYSDKRERNAGRALSINHIATTAKVKNSKVYDVIAGHSSLNQRIRRTVQILARM